MVCIEKKEYLPSFFPKMSFFNFLIIGFQLLDFNSNSFMIIFLSPYNSVNLSSHSDTDKIKYLINVFQKKRENKE